MSNKGLQKGLDEKVSKIGRRWRRQRRPSTRTSTSQKAQSGRRRQVKKLSLVDVDQSKTSVWSTSTSWSWKNWFKRKENSKFARSQDSNCYIWQCGRGLEHVHFEHDNVFFLGINHSTSFLVQTKKKLFWWIFLQISCFFILFSAF